MLSNALVARLTQSAPSTVLEALRPSHADLPYGLEVETSRGLLWRIDAPVSELWPEQERWLAALAKRSPAGNSSGANAPAVEETHAELVALRESLPDRVLLVDVKASGPDDEIFLIGVLHTHKDLPIVTQLLARGTGEEAAVLAALDDIVREKQVLVTFNGKSTSWPLVQERRATRRLGKSAAANDMVHCDLLHHARRRWKSRLPNCKLQTLEQYICGRQRATDASASDVLEVYHDYLLNNDPWKLRLALEHHALDLVTLWQLALWMAHA